MFDDSVSHRPGTAGQPDRVSPPQQPPDANHLKEQINRARESALSSHPADPPGALITHNISPLQVPEVDAKESTDLQDFSGHAWKCIEVRAGKNGGNIRRYQLETKYSTIRHGSTPEDVGLAMDNYTALVKKIYPAVEPLHSAVLELNLIPTLVDRDEDTSDINPQTEESLKSVKNGVLFGRLGFGYSVDKDDNFFVDLPDREALMANWKIHMGRLGITHQLDITSSEGISPHIDFIRDVRNSDVVLSRNEEFIHDMFAHVIPIIRIIIDAERGTPGGYQAVKAMRTEHIDKILNPLEALTQVEDKFGAQKAILPHAIQTLIERKPTLEALIGYYVDVLAAADDIRGFASIERLYTILPSLGSDRDELVRANILSNIFPEDPTITHPWQYLSLLNKLTKALPALEYIAALPTTGEPLTKLTLPPEIAATLPPPENELKKLSNAAWFCEDKLPQPDGGHLLTFRLNAQYDLAQYLISAKLTKALNDSFPFVPPSKHDVQSLIPVRDRPPERLEADRSRAGSPTGALAGKPGSISELSREEIMLELGIAGWSTPAGVWIQLPDRGPCLPTGKNSKQTMVLATTANLKSRLKL